MAKQNEALFEESSQGSVSAVTAIAFVLAFVLFFGGMMLGGYAFGVDGLDIWIFSASLAAMTVGLMIPTVFLPAIGK